MNISFSKDLDGNFNPDLYYLLKDLPKDILFNSEHQKRAPLGIYNVSTLRVFNAFDKLLSSLNDLQIDQKELSEHHIELLESLMAFYDDIFTIMKCIFPKNKVKKNIIFADKWLKEIDITTKKMIFDYQSEIAPYRGQVSTIINRVKHDHARYCHVKANTIRGIVHGFYVEDINSEGTIIPDKKIHSEFAGEYTAISYNRDVKVRLVDFLIVNSIATKFITKLISTHYGSICLQRGNNSDRDSLLNISTMCVAIPNVFFPDEYYKDMPQIIIKSQLEYREKAYASYRKKINPPKSYKIIASMIADGVTNSWAIPYFKAK